MLLDGNVRGVQHLGLPVSDIERSIRWYADTLGFQVIYQTEFHSGEGTVKVAFMKLHEFVVEMYQLPGKELEEIKKRGHGHIDHIAFDVDDIEAVYEKLKKAGIEAIEGKPTYLPFWENGVRYLTILGPDNEKVEFNQKL